MNEIIARIGRRIHNKGQSWQVSAGEHLDNGETRYKLTDCANVVLDGQTQTVWGKENFVFTVTDRDILEEKKTYEKETGNCSECLGTGKRFVGWNYKTGSRYSECKQCEGTGKTIEREE